MPIFIHLFVALSLDWEESSKDEDVTVSSSQPLSQLKEAAERKDLDSFKKLYLQCPELTDTSTGYSPIHIVFEHEFIDGANYLLDLDHSLLEKRDENGNTPLHVACSKGHVNLVKAFTLDSDACLVNNEGYSLLHVATAASKLDVIRVLVLKGFDPYEFTREEKLNCLHIACKKGNKEVVVYFLDEVGMSPHSVSGVNKELDRPGGQQPIHFAALHGHLLLLKYLINECNCDPNAEDNSGKTPALLAGECGKVEVMGFLVEEVGCNPGHTARATGKVAAKRQAIHGACFSGSLPMVKYLIATGKVDPYAADEAKVTPIACAAQEGKLEIVQYLVQAGNDLNGGPNVQDSTGRTPLHYACLKGRDQIVRYLCTEGKADVNILDNSGETCLIVACKNGHKSIVSFLMEQGYDITTSTSGGRRVIDFAALKEWLDIITYLVQEKHFNPEQLNEVGFSPVHYAAEGNSLSVLRYLLEERKCNPNLMSSEGETGTTPLHRACMFGHLNTAQYLIKDRKCPLVTTTKNKLMSPLHLACSSGHMDIVKFLIDSCGHEVEPRNNQGALPLHMAILNGHGQIVLYLIDVHKSDPTIKTKGGATGFHAAAQGGHLEILMLLLEYPRFQEFRNKLYFLSGGSPLDQAAEQGHLEIVRYLVVNDICNPRKRAGENSFTCLHWAAFKGRTEVVKYLVDEISCDILESGINGETPLHLACSKGHIDTVQFLLSKDSAQLAIKDNNKLTPLQAASKADILSTDLLCNFVMAGADSDELIKVSPVKCGFMKSCHPLYGYTKIFVLGSSGALLSELNTIEGSGASVDPSVPVFLSYKNFRHIGDVMLYAVSEMVISFDEILSDALSQCSHPVFVICFDMIGDRDFDDIGSEINYWLQFINSLLAYTADKSIQPLLSVVINTSSGTDIELLDEVSTHCLSLSIPDYQLVTSTQVVMCDADIETPYGGFRFLRFLAAYHNILQEQRPLGLFPTALRSFVLQRFHQSSLERHTLTEVSLEIIVDDAPLPRDIEKLAEGFTSLSRAGHLIFLKDNKDIGESIIVLEPGLTLQKAYEAIAEIKPGSSCVLSDHEILAQCSSVCALDPLTFLSLMQYFEYCIDLSLTKQVRKCVTGTAKPSKPWYFIPSLLTKTLSEEFVITTNQSEGEIALGWLLECEPPHLFPSPVCNLLPAIPLMCTDPPLAYCEKQNGCYNATSSVVQCVHKTTQVTLTHLQGEAILLVIKDYKNNLLSLVRKKSVIINAIFDLKSQYCSNISAHPYVLHPSCLDNMTLIDPSLSAISVEDIIQNINVISEAFNCSIEEIVGFEPLFIVTKELTRKLFDPTLNKEIISEEDLDSIVEVFAPHCDQLAIILNEELPKDLESDTERAESVVKGWVSKGKSNHGSTGRSYSDLWECMKHYSMFTIKAPPPI